MNSTDFVLEQDKYRLNSQEAVALSRHDRKMDEFNI